MKKAPFMPLWIDHYLADTQALDARRARRLSAAYHGHVEGVAQNRTEIFLQRRFGKPYLKRKGRRLH